LQRVFADVDAGIAAWERRIAAGEMLDLVEALDAAIGFAFALLHGRLAGEGAAPPAGGNLLEAFKSLVKSDPSWNAVRDNLRELIYYRNCIETGRRDALPPVAEKMAIRTARHLYLYFRTRCG